MNALNKHLILAAASQDLASFVIAFWPVAFGSVELIWTKPMSIICWAYDQMVDGNVVGNSLAINVPPRCTKSIITNVMLPAYVWLRKPSDSFLCIGTTPSLVSRDSVHCRAILESPQYAYLYKHFASKLYGVPDKLEFKGDVNLKTMYSNTEGGTRLARSINQTITGENADWILMDDLVDTNEMGGNMEQINTMLEDVRFKYDNTIRKRASNPRYTRQVCIAQKLASKDPPGFLTVDYDFNLISLPQEFMKDHPRLSELDWREEDGELLMPERFGPEQVAVSKLNEHTWRTQEQQLDGVLAGDLFPGDNWQMYFQAPLSFLRGENKQKGDIFFGVYDTANTTNARSKYTAFGFFLLRGTNIMFIDGIRIKVDLNGLLELDDEFVKKYPELSFIVVENTQSGKSLCDLRNNEAFYIRVNPQSESKEERAQFTKRRYIHKKLWLPAGHILTDVIKTEHKGFPGETSYNDLVDVFSHGCKHVELVLKVPLHGEERNPDQPPPLTLLDVLAQKAVASRRDSVSNTVNSFLRGAKASRF
jgi:phage terminase large subunit-like protein